MRVFELEAKDITELNDADLRELVGRLCEAEIISQNLATSKVAWGGAQEAADGGLDVSVLELGHLPSPNFVPRADTGIQVKKHPMSEAKCKDEMLDHGAVRPIIQELADKNGAYIIVSGKDDCSKVMLEKRLRGMQEAVAGIANKEKLFLDFYGRDRIAGWLRLHPGVSLWVRGKLGKHLSGWTSFGRWAATPEGTSDGYLSDDFPSVHFLTGSDRQVLSLLDGINETRLRILPFGSATRVTGLSGVGKTRFVQALFEEDVGIDALPASAAIYADLGEELSPTATELVNYLIANDISAILILDNCPPDVHRQLQKKVSTTGTKLRLLTVEYDISDDKPEETEVVHLEPTSEKTVSKLVQRRYRELSSVNADKISEFAGGNARVALALASRVEPEETLSSFSDSSLFERLFSQRKGTNTELLECAELLSLVYSFSVSSTEFNDELSTLGRIGGISRPKLQRAHAELLRRQLAQKRGDWRAVLPHALANNLARRALEGLDKAAINSELFKPENIRLFKSCAHRIGYLHDFEPAQELAESWIAEGAPLHDFSKCNEQQLVCLNYIAPVFPEFVLSALEVACRDTSFASRENPKFSTFVRLLRHLAYDAELFERSVNLMLKFSQSENPNENRYSVISQLKELFSLLLSGTVASPKQRQELVRKLFHSTDQRQREISIDLFHAALEATNWTSSGTFSFGARKRGHGWQPLNKDDILEWYEGYLDILEQGLSSNDGPMVHRSKSVIADNFRGLWTSAGCHERLEKIIREYGTDGSWHEVWMAIKRTQYYDKNLMNEKCFALLAELESATAPSDPYSEIEAYALTNSWNHAEFLEGGYSENEAEIRNKVTGLGRLAAVERSYITQLGDRLWESHIDSLIYFGMGVAEGSEDKEEAFDYLVSLLRRAELTQYHVPALFGFLNEVQKCDQSLFRRLVETTLSEERLTDHFVYLLSSAPIAPWGAKKLIELAQQRRLPAWSFTQISGGRIHAPIPDERLAQLLTAILDLEDGVLAVLDILTMRFHIDKDSTYYPSEVILAVGRNAIERFCAMHRDQIGDRHLQNLDNIAKLCLAASAPHSQIVEIVRLLCEGIESYRLYAFNLGELIGPLTANFPTVLLDRIYSGDEKETILAHRVFKERASSHGGPSLNLAPVSEIVGWCNGDQERFEKVAKAIRSFISVAPESSSVDHPEAVILSNHAKELLNAAPDKEPILQIIFEGAWPNGWSNSLADILEPRARAFEWLLEHPSDAIRTSAAEKIVLLQQAVRRVRTKEAEEHNKREQRFE
jgi:hypothetical protein